MSDEGITADEFHRYALGRGASRHAGYLIRRCLRGAGPVRVLEVGCGVGLTLKLISESMDEKSFAAGCDVDPEMLGFAAVTIGEIGGGRAAVVRNMADALPFADGAFDAVFSEASFHHFDARGAMLSEMWRVLKPGGKLLIVDLNPDAAAPRIYTVYIGIKKFLGIATKGETALMNSIRHALPEEEVVGEFESLGIPCRARRTLASIYYEAEKPVHG